MYALGWSGRLGGDYGDVGLELVAAAGACGGRDDSAGVRLGYQPSREVCAVSTVDGWFGFDGWLLAGLSWAIVELVDALTRKGGVS